VSQCVMCGTQISQGILCEKCDRPRTKKPAAAKPAPPPEAPKSAPAPSPGAPAPPSANAGSKQAALAAKPSAEPFPKAQIVPFPVESTSFAPTSICEVLTAAKLPSLLIGSDRSVKYCSGEAHVFLSIEPSSLPSMDQLEKQMGFSVPELLKPFTKDMDVIENQTYHRLMLLYKGELPVDSVLTVGPSGEMSVTDATAAYGIGNWHLYNGRPAEAEAVFRRIMGGGQWGAFGYIAAEAELARMK